MVPGIWIAWRNMSYETSAEPPVCVKLKLQPQLSLLPAEICSGRPLPVSFQPYCQPSTELAYDLTLFVVPVQFQLVPQPIRSPCWQVDQIDCVPEPLLAPHSLLLIQYLPSVIEAAFVDEVFAFALGVQVRLVGSRQAPKRQLVPLPQIFPQLPQFFPSVFRFVQAAPQAVCPVGNWQTPVTQVAPVAHTVPQAPQLAVLAVMSLQLPPQSPWPVGHLQALS